MMREGLLKENIDGEALMWAHNRLIGRLRAAQDPDDDFGWRPGRRFDAVGETRAIIWNGTCAPSSSRSRPESPVELLAIGIGHDVTRYYRRAVTIVDADELAGAMTEQLASLFEDKASGGSRTGPPACLSRAVHASSYRLPAALLQALVMLLAACTAPAEHPRRSMSWPIHGRKHCHLQSRWHDGPPSAVQPDHGALA